MCLAGAKWSKLRSCLQLLTSSFLHQGRPSLTTIISTSSQPRVCLPFACPPQHRRLAHCCPSLVGSGGRLSAHILSQGHLARACPASRVLSRLFLTLSPGSFHAAIVRNATKWYAENGWQSLSLLSRPDWRPRADRFRLPRRPPRRPCTCSRNRSRTSRLPKGKLFRRPHLHTYNTGTPSQMMQRIINGNLSE